MIPSTKQEEAKQIEAMTLAKKAWLDGLFPLFIGKMVGAPWDGTLTPLKINMEQIMEVWKIIFLFKWVISRFHVNLPGCNNQTHIHLAYIVDL